LDIPFVKDDDGRSVCECVLWCLWISLNGVPACANKKLLTNILRDEWNFTGYVVSDETALEFIVSQHHYVDNPVSAAAAVVKAGCNLEVTPIRNRHVVFSSIPKVRLMIASALSATEVSGGNFPEIRRYFPGNFRKKIPPEISQPTTLVITR